MKNSKPVFEKNVDELTLREFLGLVFVEIDNQIEDVKQDLSKDQVIKILENVSRSWITQFEKDLLPIIDDVPFFKACKIYQAYKCYPPLSEQEMKEVLEFHLK